MNTNLAMIVSEVNIIFTRFLFKRVLLHILKNILELKIFENRLRTILHPIINFLQMLIIVKLDETIYLDMFVSSL